MTTESNAQTTAQPSINAAPDAPTEFASVDDFVASLGIGRASGEAASAVTPAPAASATTPPVPGAANAQAPGQEPPPAQQVETPATERERQALERLVLKDKAYQETRAAARALEAQLAEVKAAQERQLAAFKADPLKFARENGVRFGDLAIAALGGDPAQPAEKPADKPGVPPEVAAELEQLRKFREEMQAERTQAAQRAQQETAVGAVRGYLEKRDFPVVNDLGLHEQVLGLAQRHFGQHGAPADDREAEETVEFYARQVEAAERQKLLAYVAKPGVKQLLAKELGFAAQNATPPARPESQGAAAGRTPAPALTNTDATQRTNVVGEQAWSEGDAMKRTLDEMLQLQRRAAG